MTETKTPQQRAPGRRLAASEKRRIVELLMRPGASIGALAREHGVHANSLRQWKVLYRAGKLDAQLKSLDAQLKSLERVAGPTASTTFVPVNVVQPMRRPQPTTRHDASACGSSVLQLVLASGATLRIEASALDAALVCALVAQLQR